MYKIGLTLGKFMPPHKGHELLIDFAASMCDSLFVMVSGKEDDEIPLSLRVNWLTDHYRNTNVGIYDDINDIKMGKVDEYGTVIDDEFWVKWKFKILDNFPLIDYVFTSDRYGCRLAKEIGAEWIPCDINRDITNGLNATTIRGDTLKFFDYMIDEAKAYYRKSIVFVGAESTGKTIMSQCMADRFYTVNVPEYGRIFSESKNNILTPDDFNIIVSGQQALKNIMTKSTGHLIFQDTEMMTTYLYGKIYTGKDLIYIKEQAIKQHFDMYVVLAPTIPWIDDGTRIMSNEEERWKFHNEMVEFLTEFNKPFCVINETTYDTRKSKVIDIVNKMNS